jgi:hypothetical protein
MACKESKKTFSWEPKLWPVRKGNKENILMRTKTMGCKESKETFSWKPKLWLVRKQRKHSYVVYPVNPQGMMELCSINTLQRKFSHLHEKVDNGLTRG